MKKNKEDRNGISQSFVMGVIALVFMLTGYQTALFIHDAAVTRIAANRDCPDTVYIYKEYQQQNSDVEDGMPGSDTVVRMEIRRSGHTEKAEAVRANVPYPRVESFRFDPNTATEDDFCRLGFSKKQAKSILNYRLKGGRFRRKEDFAKSFVVSDSVFRRLESYIDIPLIDLNLADSAALDALPGIGGWFALKIMEHRERLKGYSYKEQLMDIWKFDSQKYDALADLVAVNPENIIPYPLWTYPADSLRKHPYIRNYETARAIVLYRETTPQTEWSVEKLSAAGILSESAAEKLSRCVIASP